MLVDPQGYAVAALEGEGNAKGLEKAIADIIPEHRERGTLNESPVEMLPPAVPSGPLRFPGKVAAGPNNLLAVAGTGARGMDDGAFSAAAFHDPQGLLFLDERSLLVADTGNHAIRRLDLADRTVETIAGKGEQARWGAEGGLAKKAALNSPWDLELWDGLVAIAMAGPHQLWALDLEKGEVHVLAENGRLWVADSETSSLR